MYTVITVPAFSDNYIWLIRHENNCLVVDPGEAAPVLERLAALDLVLDAILLTHHHRDHVGGVSELLQHFPHARLYGPKHDPMPDHHGQWLDDGDQINWHGLSLDVLHVPGHTLGHIAYYGQGMLFCGDTLFSAGCGRLFEGTPAQMHTSLQRLAALPDETLLYCAHEYTLSNLRFAHAVEPDNLAIQRQIGVISKLRQQGLPSLPSRLGDERNFNVFLRCEQDSVKFSAEKYALKCLENPEDTFAVLRAWKDVF
ncbi:hydroxyacylglutathione hydrolase [Aeromonas caviae]|uniref:hydroxyacylglutathione hydrolase n=1 Tax=Aeromonas caviae TaxID=648 RepID=UPI002B48BCD2|nr:hydroxyacylglutathione hydrolase [Aeromonas caviae]